MPRPIDADALKQAFEEDGHLSGYIEDFINDTPTLDVEPVRRGKWVPHESGYGWDDAFACSVCEMLDIWMHNYCPQCGAKMEVE